MITNRATTKYVKIVDGTVMVAKVERALRESREGKKFTEDPLEMLAALEPSQVGGAAGVEMG